jgi:hypothetical protein
MRSAGSASPVRERPDLLRCASTAPSGVTPPQTQAGEQLEEHILYEYFLVVEACSQLSYEARRETRVLSP